MDYYTTVFVYMDTTLDSIRDIRLYQRKRGYRFSIDALLLFSFVNLKSAGRIIDLGAGSGVVGLLLARKYPRSSVTLVELQEGLFELMKKNIELNGLTERVFALRGDIRELPSGVSGFDLAVSNPPFRRPLSGRLSGEEEKAVARHEIRLTLGGLVSGAVRVLRERGRLCLIHHPQRLGELVGELRGMRLEPKRMRFVHGRPSSEAKMLLLEAVKGGSPGLKVEPPLFVYKEDGSYTEELRGVCGG